MPSTFTWPQIKRPPFPPISDPSVLEECRSGLYTMTPGVSLTIPAHNEALNIAAVVHGARDALASFATEYEIVLVDDASTDGTADAARAALGEDASRLRVVTHDRQRGYAVTVCDGLRASRGRLLAFMDGDGQFDARDLGTLLTRSAHADLVAGCRARRADPWYRSLVGRVYNAVVRLAFGLRWRDFDCGLKVIRREAYQAVSPIHATSAVFNPEIFFDLFRFPLAQNSPPLDDRLQRFENLSPARSASKASTPHHSILPRLTSLPKR